MTEHATFDQHARDYDETVQRAIGASGETVQFFADLKARLMSAAVGNPQPRRVLDFGCGVGNATRALAAQFPASDITGTDVSDDSISTARRRTPGTARIRFATAHQDRLPFEDGTFDAAFTSCVFHHIEPSNRIAWARELLRVLVPHGTLFVFEHNPFNPLTLRVVNSVPFDEGVVLLKPGDTREMLRQAGFAASRPSFYFFFPSRLRSLRRLEPLLQRIPIGAQYFVVGRSSRPVAGEINE
jgi:ubiquinone/menaquinone biosynthesis C-methylase UbiE